MATLNRSTQDKQSPACPVVATEAGQIFILDPQTFTPMHEVCALLYINTDQFDFNKILIPPQGHILCNKSYSVRTSSRWHVRCRI